MKAGLAHTLTQIKSFFFDVDGVFTNGHVRVMENGQLVRTLNARDSYAVQLAVKKGYHLAVFTGGNSAAVKAQLEQLGIKHIYLKCHDKLEVFEDHITGYSIDPAQCSYMGDDIPDYQVMQRVGLAACPKDAAREIQGISQYVSPYAGGEGCVRDLIQGVMMAQGTWFKEEESQRNFKDFMW
ncbi:3-deoxy-D-manno-octulosonate 8-phosphate phosphatase [bacterium SCSIO 12741]|nr:3-deoxy-D-manno-octulosonate 8-phosphate phosphatase [bacterium SCSIO 12741]